MSNAHFRSFLLTTFATVIVVLTSTVAAAQAPLIISEFRLRGPLGATDEFVEIYNNSDSPVTVATVDGSIGYALVASNGIARFVIPNGTVIPARGHYLGVNSVSYSLSTYPSGNGTSATGNVTYTSDIPDNAGIALFSTSNPANFVLANRLDAVGSTSEANALYREGGGYPALVPFNIDYSFTRALCPIPAACSGLPQDINNNSVDFIFVDTNGTSAGAGQRLGAPAPENLSSPIRISPSATPDIASMLLDPIADPFGPPNFVRNFTSDPANNSTFGTITIRRTVTNNSAIPVTRLRFRVIELTTFPSPAGTADLRPRTASSTTVALTDGSFAPVAGTTLEQPPTQPNGSGFNSSLSAGIISLGSPLTPGSSVNVQFLLGIQQTGTFRYSVMLETLPATSSDIFSITADTQTPPPPVAPSLLISEFRLRGPSGANDEFVEIYNNTDSSMTVSAFDGSAGYAVAASDGVIRFTIPNGTTIPARGHYLGVNSVSYSLGSYPGGNGITTANSNYSSDIPDNAGIALFRTANTANFSAANRFDAVGSTSEANALYKEGGGYPALVPFNIDYSFVRRFPSFGAGIGLPIDTGNNSNDYIFVDTNGTSAGAGQRLGAPGPENLSGPRDADGSINHVRIDTAQTEFDSPNVARSLVSDPANNSTFGTLSVRRTFTNNSGSSLTRLRFRVIDLSTFPSPSGTADLRPRTSPAVNVTLTESSVVTAQGTTLEQPPNQPNGGGFNSSMSANSVSAGSPLAAGASISVQFLFGVQQSGCYRFAIVAESLPLGGSDVFLISGDTEGPPVTCATPTPTPAPTATPTPTPNPGGALLISEFRLRGPAGANDEFVEIYNNSDSAHTVSTTDGSSGFALVASDGVTRFTIPNGIVIPARGHYLGVNSVGYSIGGYPAGAASTATGNATFTTNINDNAGLALFKTSNPVNFTFANRLDAVGSSSEPNSLYKEGSGYSALTPFNIDYSFYRLIPSDGPNAGISQDTNDNATDLVFVDTNGTSAGAGQRLGAPGPENLSGPGHLSTGLGVTTGLVDTGVAADAFPNLYKNPASDPANNATFGTLSFRRAFTNNSGSALTRLRFRIINLSTFPAPAGTADLRPRSSSSISVPLSGGGMTTVSGTTLEQPPSQPNGGGFNSSFGAALFPSIPNGGTANLQFAFGIQQTGDYRICLIAETTPIRASDITCFIGNTNGGPPPPAAPLIISEFRLRGPGGAQDEFVEIYNNSDSNYTVQTFDGSSGFSVAASNGAARFTIPNGTVIPARGHYLGVHSAAYSIGAYPAGVGTTATGNSTYNADIPDNAGIALFRTSNAAGFVIGNRLDAVGSTSEANALYREGSGYPALTPFAIDYSFVRKVPNAGGGAGLSQDTNNNANDFLFVDTNGTSAGAGQRLGAPGPENLSGPGHKATGGLVTTSLVDTGVTADAFPNYFKDPASEPANNSTFGSMSFRRKFTNSTGAALTRLRFRVINLSTFPSPAGTADLRPRSSSNISVPLSGGGSASVNGTTLEQPPSQPNGGGFNSSMSVSLGSLANGSSLNLQFVFGIQQTGDFNICLVAETLPIANSDITCFSGSTSGGTPPPTPPLIISEFRLRGSSGQFDEFVEIYNNSDTNYTVQTFDGSSGFSLAASDGLARFTIPNGTVIPGRGHYLGVNSLGYAIGAYPAGNGTTATGNATFTTNIPDNAGIALFRTSKTTGFVLENRLDAVGATSEANATYKEGAGYPALVAFSIDYSFFRKIPTSGGSAGVHQDTNNNANDFQFVDTNGTSAGAGQKLGAGGPENLSSPGHKVSGSALVVSLVDPLAPATGGVNYNRNFTSDPANNSTFGTATFRRKFTNNTGVNITRLRFRIIDLTTFPSPGGVSDLRPRNTGSTVVSLSGGGFATVEGTTVETPPNQPNGGGIHTSMSANSISSATPLNNGLSVNLQFRVGVQQNGTMNFCTVVDTLPFSGTTITCYSGNSSAAAIIIGLAQPIIDRHNNNLINVGLSVRTDMPADINVRVFGDEDDETPSAPGEVFSPDARNIAPDTLRLRAERIDGGDGRVYLIVVKATTEDGNVSRACETVVVPRNQNQNQIDNVLRQAAAAKAFCEENNGDAPRNFFKIGDGPSLQ